MAIYFLDLLCLSAFGLRKFSIDYEVLDLLATLLTPFLSSLLGSYPINLNIRNGKKLNFICVCQDYAGILDLLDGIFSWCGCNLLYLFRENCCNSLLYGVQFNLSRSGAFSILIGWWSTWKFIVLFVDLYSVWFIYLKFLWIWDSQLAIPMSSN